MRRIVSGRALGHTVASTSQMGRFDANVLTQRKNLRGTDGFTRTADRHGERTEIGKKNDCRFGFVSQFNLWPPGKQCLQRPFWLYLPTIPCSVSISMATGNGHCFARAPFIRPAIHTLLLIRSRIAIEAKRFPKFKEGCGFCCAGYFSNP